MLPLRTASSGVALGKLPALNMVTAQGSAPRLSGNSGWVRVWMRTCSSSSTARTILIPNSMALMDSHRAAIPAGLPRTLIVNHSRPMQAGMTSRSLVSQQIPASAL